MKEIVRDDIEKNEFLVHRSVFTDKEILAHERAEIFNKCWLFIGHETEVAKPGDYKRKKLVAGIYYWSIAMMGKSGLYITLVHTEGPLFAERMKEILVYFAVFIMLGALKMMAS